VVISCSPDSADELVAHFERAGVLCTPVGKVGGDCLKINQLIKLDLKELSEAFYEAMPRFMERIS